MSKYIDADKLTKDLERLCDIVCQYSKKQRDVMCRSCPLGDAFELLDNQPAVDIPRWIPVTERLPKHEKTRYWICTDTGYQCECRWTDNRFGMGTLSGKWGWSIFDTPQYSKVIAWMPLPEPYKGGEEE